MSYGQDYKNPSNDKQIESKNINPILIVLG